MSPIPIVEQIDVAVDSQQCARAERLAEQLLREQPRLRVNDSLQPLIVQRLDAAPTLHLDDLAGIPLINRFDDFSYSEDRARLRAGDGDLVASCTPANDLFERYCSDRLQLGEVKWLHPDERGDPMRVATACWSDRQVRQELVTALKRGGLRYLHPYIGSTPVWTLATLLSKASGRPLQVLAPPPSLTAAVNDKNWFADVAKRLLGRSAIPETYRAYSLAGLAHAVRYLAAHAEQLVIKIPDSAGGAGNLVLNAAEICNLTHGDCKRQLRELLQPLRWKGGSALLVGTWESDVLSTPSCQIWVPPEAQGLPVVEGVFQQLLESREGVFLGAYPIPELTAVTRAFTADAWLLARLFQRLGYRGRCSFDAIVVGAHPANARHEFIECNGRWGGASIPMTLMNRLFGDRAAMPYAVSRCELPGLERISFAALLEALADELYDARTNRGRLVLFNPDGLRESGIDMIVLGASVEEATQALVDYPRRLRAIVERTAPA